MIAKETLKTIPEESWKVKRNYVELLDLEVLGMIMSEMSKNC